MDYIIYRDEFYDWMKNEQKLTMADDLIKKLDRVEFTKINTVDELYQPLKKDKTKTLRVALRAFLNS